jgi:cysteinyl-tRNA synthetase
LRQGNVPPLLDALCKFNQLFPVLRDDDAEKVQRVVEWARAEGRGGQIRPQALELARSAQMSDERVEALMAERQQARKNRDFARSDEIRDQLAAAGIVVEDAKDGVRWKRK